MKTDWIENGLRITQYNLQVEDTEKMDPHRIAVETQESAANAVVINVGGIYAWYQSKVPFHRINEHLPKDRDLLKEMIEEFHALGIKVIARYDFSLADDYTYQMHPEWFARKSDKTPLIHGAERFGNWNLLMTTCALGGYRNEEVAVPIIKEVLDNYDIDGIFLNAPTAPLCYCEHCQHEHIKKYGTPLPENPVDIEFDWLSYLTKLNMDNLYKAIKDGHEDIPLILYYAPYSSGFSHSDMTNRDNIYDRFETADYICTEAQDVLSAGMHDIPFLEKPSLNMKAGYEPESGKRPFGIIHACPGMDWRHVGLPVSEYMPWMAQTVASNGILWHSVTGYPLTNADENVMKCVSDINHMAAKTEPFMKDASYYSDVLLLWNGNLDSRNMASLLMKSHVQFDLMHEYRIDPDRMGRYRIVIIPYGFAAHAGDAFDAIIRKYVKDGGRVICEDNDASVIGRLHDIFGVESNPVTGEYLAAAYAYLDSTALRAGIDCDKVPFRGEVAYCKPVSAEVLMTLVPPFAPLSVVGRPPERASMQVSHTDIPLLTDNAYGHGHAMLIPYCFSDLFCRYHMRQHLTLMENLIKGCIVPVITTNAPAEVQISAYVKDEAVIVHFVNEVGTRPLLDTIPIDNVEVACRLPEGRTVSGVHSVLSDQNIEYLVEGNTVKFCIPRVGMWEMVSVELN